MRWALPVISREQSLFFQIGGEELHCLDSVQTLILEGFQRGFSAEEICSSLNKNSEDGALDYVRALQKHWEESGLLELNSFNSGNNYSYQAYFLLGFSSVAFYSEYFELYERLIELFPLQKKLVAPDHLIEVKCSDTSVIELLIDGESRHQCHSFDQLLIACLFEMGELATHEFPRLFVAHAAAVRNESQVLLMPGHAGQGKSTLTAGLIKKGYQLINDDIVPINFDGSLVAINSPLKIKSGSWSVLSNLYPELDEIKPVMRADDQLMKLVPQAEHSCAAGSTHMPTAIIIPEYSPKCEPELIQLEKGEGLSSILLTEPFLPHRLSRQYLQAIADWQAELPVWRVRYKHTDEAAQLLASLPV